MGSFAHPRPTRREGLAFVPMLRKAELRSERSVEGGEASSPFAVLRFLLDGDKLRFNCRETNLAGASLGKFPMLERLS